ncbi:MAG: glucoamylase family protein [Chryseolinea sp.]
MTIRKIVFLIAFASVLGCEKDKTERGPLELRQAFVGTQEINLTAPLSEDLPVDRSMSLVFSSPVNQTAAVNSIELQNDGQQVNADVSFSSDNVVVIRPVGTLATNTIYTLALSDQLQGSTGEPFVPREISFKTAIGSLRILSVEMGGDDIAGVSRIMNVPLNLAMTINFSAPVSESSFNAAADLSGANAAGLNILFSNNSQTVSITSTVTLRHLTEFELQISSSLKGASQESFSGYSTSFYTGLNETPQLPVVSDEELLSKVQQQTFKYFWDLAHPASGMARERNTSGNIVTSGGSGFGIMALVVGIERNFVSRAAGVQRMDKIVTFLEDADRFHGAWSHWLDGNTGDVVPFSSKDNGGDLVETSFLVQGLLTFRQYLQPSDTAGNNLINRITNLWETVEWDWYRKNNENVLYWHWSPNYTWDMNFPLYGYFEQQITYVLAASSPTYGIPKIVYSNGYAKNGTIVKNNTHYGYKLPLESPSPLFWVHYSYLGLDPHFSDGYANYWEQNVNATSINQAYCIANPKNFVGYSQDCWGLTSSDEQGGYDAHSPANDNGVITPTAALSSFPYTPDESMKALKFFYYNLGDRLWGEYGFYDAFNLTTGWTADSYLAIDQGPIIIMIENHRTGLIWELFMSAPEVQNGMTTLEFTN